MAPSLKSTNWQLHFFLLLFVIYYSQGLLYPSGSFISQSALFLYILISVFCFLKLIILKNKPKFLSIWISFMILHCITFAFSPKVVYGILYEAIGEINIFDQFKGILIFLLSFIVAYYFAKKYQLSANVLIYFSVVFLVLAVFRFFYFFTTISFYDNDSLIGNVTNNTSYMVLSVCPYVPLIYSKNKLSAILVIFLISFLVILGAKRGAIISFTLVILSSVFYYLKSNKISIKTFSLVSIFIGAIIYFAYNQYLSNEYLQKRFDATLEGNSSNRDIAYNTLFKFWSENDNIFVVLFGNGMAQTVSVWGNYAHNDWLELLINNGLLGVSMYFSLFASLLFSVAKLSLNPYYSLSAYLCLLIWFLKSLFSMGYMDLGSSILTILLGFILGLNNNNQAYSKSLK